MTEGKRVGAPAINETGRETDFVRRKMVGDRQAEAELIDCYTRGIRIIIRRAGGKASTIDDVYQDTFRCVYCPGRCARMLPFAL